MTPIPKLNRCLQHSFTFSRTCVFALAASTFAAFLGTAPVAAQARSQILTPGATYRAAAEPARTRDTYRLTVEKAGLLTLDVSEPLLLWLDPPDLPVVHSRPGSRVLWVEQPGTLEIAVTAVKPGAPLGAYRLRNAFVAGTTAQMEEMVLVEDPPNTCAGIAAPLGRALAGGEGVVVPQNVDEWDCDVLEGGTLTAGILRLESRLGALQASLFGSTTCGNPTLIGAGVLSGVAQVLAPVFPGPFRIAVEAAAGYAGSYLLAASLLDPCRQGEQDDHHETWLCATPLTPGDAVAGTIGNSHGDDVDGFTFTLELDQAVQLSWDSQPGPWRLRVSDAAGQAIATSTGASDWQSRLAKGRYFVALDRPDGSSADYEMTLTVVP